MIARLVARALIDRSEPVDVERHQFPSSVGAAFDEYLHRFGDDEQRVRDLLEPLAWAEGKGFPTRRIWPEVASKLSGNDYGPRDLRWLTDEARDLLVQDLEDDRPVFRLFHEALAENLRRAGDQYGPDVQSDIVDALRNTLRPPAEEERRWFEAHPYIRRYFAVHAAAAERLDEFVTDPWFLAATEPRNLLPALQACSKELAKVAAMVYREAVDQLVVTQSLEERLSYIHLSAKKLSADFIASQFRNSESMPWRALWMHWHATPRLRLTHPFQVAMATTLTRRYGQDVVACGMSDGSILLWRLSDGSVQDDLSIDHGLAITALCSARIRGKDAIISGGIDGSLCAWNVEDGSRIFTWTDNSADSTFPPFISSLVSHTSDEGDAESTDAIVALTSDKLTIGSLPIVPVLRLLDFASLTVSSFSIPQLLNAATYNPTIGWHKQPIPLAAIQSHRGKILVVCSIGYGFAIIALGEDEVRVVESIGESPPIEPNQNGYTARMIFTRNGMRNETVLESAVVTAVALGTRNGETVILSGDQYGEIRVWNAADTARISLPKMQHALATESRMITALAPIRRFTQELVASGDSGGRILFWDLADGQAIEPGIELDNEIVAIEACQHQDGLILVVLTVDGAVSVVDVDEVERSRRKREVTPLATQLSADPLHGGHIVWARHEDGWIRAWDAQEGTRFGDLQFGDGRANIFAPVDFQGSPGVVFADGKSRSRELERWDEGDLRRTRVDIGDLARALSCAYIGEILCAVTGGGRIQAWQTVSGKRFGRSLPKSRTKAGFYQFDTVALTRIDGEWIVLAIFPPRTIRRWKLLDRKLIEPDIVLGTKPKDMAVDFGGGDVDRRQITSFVHVPGDPSMIIAGDSEGSLWGWEFHNARLTFEFQDVHTGPVGVLTVLESEQELMLVSGGRGMVASMLSGLRLNTRRAFALEAQSTRSRPSGKILWSPRLKEWFH